jgi:hypothetical protein
MWGISVKLFPGDSRWNALKYGSWRRTTLEEDSLEGTMEEEKESWRGDGRGIMEEESWTRNRGEIMDEES